MGELRAGFRHATSRLASAGRLRAGLDAEAAADLAWAMTSIPVWEQLTIDCARPAAQVRQRLATAVTDAVTSPTAGR
jgi:hypothetical protein